jgi:hypothetical protein
MNQQIRFLRDLQQVNDEIRECEDEKAALRAALEKRRSDIHDQQARIDELQKKIKETKKEEATYNLDLKSNEEDIKKLLGQLTQVKTNEEYSVLNKRVEEERKQNSALEDSILKLMTDVDEMESQLHSFKDALAKEQAEIARFETKVNSDTAATDARVKEHRVQAAGIEKTVEPEVVEKYHKLFERLDGDVMAALDKNAAICLGCNLPVTRQDINLVLADNAIIYCKSCGRMLYIPEDEAQSN